MVSILGCAGEIGVGVENDVFREMKMERMRGLMVLSVIVDCKNIFDKGSGSCLFGYREG